MYQRDFDHFKVAVTGVTVTTTISTSQGATLPVNAAGDPPRFCRFVATGTCFVRTRNAAATAVTTDLMLPAGVPMILDTLRDTHYAVIDNGAAVTLNITPLEAS